MDQQHLNAAQRQAVEDRLSEAITTYMRDVNLRKWCVEQALTHCARHSDFKELEKMFEAIYQFTAKSPGERQILNASATPDSQSS